MKFNEQQSGFTFIEMVVSLALFVVLALGMIQLSSILLTTVRQQGGLLADSDQARKLSFQIISEIRNAVTSNTGAYPLDTAGDQTIIFYSNVDGGVDIERIRYFISAGSLWKGQVKPTGSPLTYNLGNETTWIVQRNIANASNPLFYYYNGSYNGVSGSPLTQTVNVTQVRFVRMSLRVFNKAGVKNTTYYTVNAGGTVRGVKDNLAD